MTTTTGVSTTDFPALERAQKRAQLELGVGVLAVGLVGYYLTGKSVKGALLVTGGTGLALFAGGIWIAGR